MAEQESKMSKEWIEDNCQEGYKMSNEDWIKAWEDPKFHSNKVNQLFTKHHDKLQLVPGGGSRVFVPLCGKAVEMGLLAVGGHTVVGVEVAPIACESFFTENNIKFTKSPIGKIDGDVYTSTDDKMKVKLYCCDFYQFTPDIEGDFDVVWDSGAMNAIDAEDHGKYLDVIKPLMAPGCCDLTEFCFSPDWTLEVSTDSIQEKLGAGYTCTLVDDVEAWPEMKEMMVDSLQVYLIKKDS